MTAIRPASKAVAQAAGGSAPASPGCRWCAQFLVAGGVVMLAALLVIGSWITERIEQSVVDNTASATALYVEAFISPLSQELAASDTLSEPARRALQESFASTGLRDRIVSFKIWKKPAAVIYATDPTIIGQRFEVPDELRQAWHGEVIGTLEALGDDESAREAALGIPLLEVYSPIREVWSGEVIAVAEFYEQATALRRDLVEAEVTSWLLVAAVFGASGLALLGIVRAGGNTIRRQERSSGRRWRQATGSRR